jgi:chemotaxis protein CheD
MSSLVKVGMADLKVVRFPDGLTTLGLGSCVGICVFDPTTRIAGMAHIMLPSSKAIKNNSNEAKFADTAIIKMVGEMVGMGANRSRLFAKIAGGSQMFAISSNNDTMKVGLRNAEAVKSILGDMGIPIKAEDTGGNYGRTIEFYTENGSLLIKTIGHGIKEL